MLLGRKLCSVHSLHTLYRSPYCRHIFLMDSWKSLTQTVFSLHPLVGTSWLLCRKNRENVALSLHENNTNSVRGVPRGNEGGM